MDLEEKIKEIEENMKNRVTNGMLSQFRQEMETKLDENVNTLKNIIEDEQKKIEEMNKSIRDMRKNIEEIEENYRDIQENVKHIGEYQLKYDKLLKRVGNLEEIVGVEERVDVNKVPPTILQLVYQYTLDDAVKSLVKIMGVQESERILIDVLQDVRTKTSGTELFKYMNGRIITKDIAKAIEKKLISPKQIHLTYVEIVNKIKEYIPNYIPKNFASLIRVKGEEYAIETSTENRMRIEMNEINMEKLKNEISSLENSLREEILRATENEEKKVLEKFGEIEKKMEGFNNELNRIYKDVEQIYEGIKLVSPYIEIFKRNLFDEILQKLPPEGIEKSKMGYPDSVINEFMKEMKPLILEFKGKIYSVKLLKEKVMDVIGDKNISFSEIRKKTGYDKGILNPILNQMVKENLLVERKYGKGKKYKRR